MRRLSTLAAAALLLALPQTACIVGGYSSEGGWFIWPGSLAVTAVIVAALFLLARRRRR